MYNASSVLVFIGGVAHDDLTISFSDFNCEIYINNSKEWQIFFAHLASNVYRWTAPTWLNTKGWLRRPSLISYQENICTRAWLMLMQCHCPPLKRSKRTSNWIVKTSSLPATQNLVSADILTLCVMNIFNKHYVHMYLYFISFHNRKTSLVIELHCQW